MSTLWDKLCSMKEVELLPLLLDAEELDKTGILPLDAPLRKFTEEFYGSNTVLQMTSVSYLVYKIFATAYVSLNHSRSLRSDVL